MRLGLRLLAFGLCLSLAATTVLAEEGDAPAFDPVVDELLEKAASDDRDARRDALDSLLGKKDEDINGMVIGLLSDTKDEGVAEDCLRALGKHDVEAAVDAAIEKLEHKKPGVRSYAAVCLERLDLIPAMKPLLKRAGREKDTLALKNALRALGVCGKNEKDAASTLVKRFKHKTNIVGANAILAASNFTMEGKVRSSLASQVGKMLNKTSDIRVRSACLYTLGVIGTKKEIEVLEKFKGAYKNTMNPMARAGIAAADVAIEKIRTGGTDAVSGAGTDRIFTLASDDERDPARDGDPEAEVPAWLGGDPRRGGGRGGRGGRGGG